MSLEKMSLTELRGIAQSLGVKDVFSKTANEIRSEIVVKQEKSLPVAPPPIPKPVYDARLMSRVPSRFCTKPELDEMIQPYVQRGLTLLYPEPEQWIMTYKGREDSGTLRQPLVSILRCADRLTRE